MKAIWKGRVIAESDDTVVVENNHYFPKESLQMDLFHESDYTTVCPWKGTASYYSLRSEEGESRNAAWYYPEPKQAAEKIRDRVAFWKDVEVVE